MNFKKAFWNIIVSIGYILLIYLSIFNPHFSNELLKKITYIFPLTCTFFIYLYNNWNNVFILVRKGIARVFGDTVAWSLSYKKYIEANCSYEEFTSKLYSLLKKYSDNNLLIENNKEDRLRISYYSKGLKYVFTVYYEKQIDNFQLLINMDASTAYKHSKLVTEEFFNFVYRVNEITPPLFSKDGSEKIHIKNSFYSATIQMAKYNPFYRYTVKHIQPIDNAKFKMQISLEDKTTLKITRHKLVINNANEEILKKIFKEYVPISTIG